MQTSVEKYRVETNNERFML